MERDQVFSFRGNSSRPFFHIQASRTSFLLEGNQFNETTHLSKGASLTRKRWKLKSRLGVAILFLFTFDKINFEFKKCHTPLKCSVHKLKNLKTPWIF